MRSAGLQGSNLSVARTEVKAVSLALNLLKERQRRALASYETPTFPILLNPALRIAFVGRSSSCSFALWSVNVSLFCCGLNWNSSIQKPGFFNPFGCVSGLGKTLPLFPFLPFGKYPFKASRNAPDSPSKLPCLNPRVFIVSPML